MDSNLARAKAQVLASRRSEIQAPRAESFDARKLYRSVRRLMQLPGETRVFLCHDYMAPDRTEYAFETTIAAERAGNIHLHDGIGEEEFVAMRTERYANLPMPRLILPSIQINMRGGRLPEPNGVRYLKLPLNWL